MIQLQEVRSSQNVQWLTDQGELVSSPMMGRLNTPSIAGPLLFSITLLCDETGGKKIIDSYGDSDDIRMFDELTRKPIPTVDLRTQQQAKLADELRAFQTHATFTGINRDLRATILALAEKLQ
jgi:hypothetical protein